MSDDTKNRSILDEYVKFPPAPETAFGLFEGEWSSHIPGFGIGGAQLFDDHRVKWWGEKIGGFQNKRVLELGPLEGGHTCMMSRAGARSVTAIESNSRAFMKCLIVQNAVRFNADFLLGDFTPYLKTTDEKFDFLLASGVLYHMMHPVSLLLDAMRVTDRIGIWTHYYDDAVIQAREDLARKFDKEPQTLKLEGRTLTLYKQSYLQALEWRGFCGGADPNSFWMTRNSIVSVFSARDFDVEIGADEPNHPNGPCMTLLATRRR